MKAKRCGDCDEPVTAEECEVCAAEREPDFVQAERESGAPPETWPTRERTVWIKHLRHGDGLHELVIGDDGGEFARTCSRSIHTTLEAAQPYVADLIHGSPVAFTEALKMYEQPDPTESSVFPAGPFGV